tara:strand:- start:856 stop:1464 length:609 start_codon:yes stop_codon:yes gene_type:complete
MFRYIIFCLLIFAGCAGSSTQLAPPKTQRNYHNLLAEYISCTGKGKIDSQGPLKGALTFTFISQNDSSFLQFKDLLGRKALLMWLTPQNVAARNLIDHKQYNYGQILDYFPFLQIVEPEHITKILWGVQPDYKNEFNNTERSDEKNIHLKFEKNDLNNESNALVGATFSDENTSQSVKICITGRTRTQTHQNLKKVWRLLQI